MEPYTIQEALDLATSYQLAQTLVNREVKFAVIGVAPSGRANDPLSISSTCENSIELIGLLQQAIRQIKKNS